MKREELDITKRLNKRGKFFCPAKWTELYLYLNHGNSSSCSHPIAHKIPLEELDKNLSALHNTKYKMEQQQSMLDDKRPRECHMCWSLEDADQYVLSDRIHKSKLWESEIETLGVDPNYIPKFIEIIFDSTCNLSCSYCDSGQSSTWANRIKRNPLLLPTDHRKLYSRINVQPGQVNEIYNLAWRKWFNEIKHELQILKVSGGEAMLSKNFWSFMSEISDLNHMNFIVNSNFCVKPELINQFTEYEKCFKKLKVSASIDATGSIAEYSRQGLDYKLFLDNCHRYLTNTESAVLQLQSTVSVLNIFGYTDKIDLNIELRKQYGDRIRPFYSTMVRFPEFQSLHILPDNIRQSIIKQMKSWYLKRSQLLLNEEQDLFNKILAYLVEQPEMLKSIEIEKLRQDFCRFIRYYDSYSVMKFKDVYPTPFVEWMQQYD